MPVAECPRCGKHGGSELSTEADRLVGRARLAQCAFERWEKDRVDGVLCALAETVDAHAERLAVATVHETGLGNVPDKTEKNRFAAKGVLRSLLGQAGHGVLRTDERGVTEVAAPVGVVLTLVPRTNPVATTVNHVLIALKAGDALIVSPHHDARHSVALLGDLLDDVLRAHGAPEALVQVLRGPGGRERTRNYMHHPGVALILATGGPGVVQAAYSSGTPAIGVGSGNTPAYVARDADVPAAARCIVRSTSFDGGVICGAERHLVVEREVLAPVVATLEREGAAVLDAREADALLQTIFTPGLGPLRACFVGRPAAELAAAAGLRRPFAIRLLVLPAAHTGPWSRALHGDRLAPVATLFTVDGEAEGRGLCARLLAHGGLGHTAVVHSADQALPARFAVELPVSRLLVNTPAAHGCIGMGNGLVPSLTLGCGTLGGSSTTDNVSLRHLLNVKRIARPVAPNTEGRRRGAGREPRGSAAFQRLRSITTIFGRASEVPRRPLISPARAGSPAQPPLVLPLANGAGPIAPCRGAGAGPLRRLQAPKRFADDLADPLSLLRASPCRRFCPRR